MQNILRFKILFLSSILFTTSCLASTKSFTDQAKISQLVENIQQNTERRKRNCGKHVEKKKIFKLSDFAGEWVFSADTVGGVTGGVGESGTAEAQLTIHRNGTGTFNSGTVVIYRGVPGQIDIVDLVGFTLSIQLNDPKRGTGEILLITPDGTLRDKLSFVALRNNGKVVRIEGHGLLPNPQTPAVLSYTLERQDQFS